MNMVVSPAMSNPSESTEKTIVASRCTIEVMTALAFLPCLTNTYLGQRCIAEPSGQIDRGSSHTRPRAIGELR
jgi:hypothetical protein